MTEKQPNIDRSRRPLPLDEIRGRSDRIYALLDAALQDRHDAQLDGDGEGGWNAAQVYGHLARWLHVSRETLNRHLRGEPTSETGQDEDEDALNNRWAAEDTGLTAAEARARCNDARERLFAALADIAPENWDATVDLIARDDTISHPQAHVDSLA